MFRPLLRLLAAVLVLVLPALPAPSLAQPAEAPACGALEAEAFTCSCAVAAPTGGVWGTGPYTGDSAICTAALHAGLLVQQIAGGLSTWVGTVAVQPSAGCPYYFGSTANGVTALSYGPFESSFYFPAVQNGACDPDHPAPAGVAYCPAQLADDATSLTCFCPPALLEDGTVWGTFFYTSDSALCRAALHAGVITADGGTVEALSAPGRQGYAASERNGVTSYDYGAWARSLTFAGLETGTSRAPRGE